MDEQLMEYVDGSSSAGMDEEMAVAVNHQEDSQKDGSSLEGDIASNQAFFAEQISQAEYQVEGKQGTKVALQELQSSEAYKRWFNTCSVCRSCWYDGYCLAVCAECEGYALQRPCPICNGKCLKMWARDVQLSKSMKKPHWYGECGLPTEEQEVYLMRLFTKDVSVTEAMEELNTG